MSVKVNISKYIERYTKIKNITLKAMLLLSFSNRLDTARSILFVLFLNAGKSQNIIKGK